MSWEGEGIDANFMFESPCSFGNWGLLVGHEHNYELESTLSLIQGVLLSPGFVSSSKVCIP